MAGYILLGTLAAIGVLSLCWIIFGVLLPEATGGVWICVQWPEETLLRRYKWLRDVGLLHIPMIIVTEDPEMEEGLPQISGVEFCSGSSLVARLERERRYSDGTGNGDPSGRHQRRGISEL